MANKQKHRVTACEHTERPHAAKGMCGNCYRASYARDKRRRLQNGIDLQQPDVAKTVATTLLQSGMDAQATVRTLRPDLSGTGLGAEVKRLQNSPEVEAQMQDVMRSFGLDERSKDKLISTLWEWLGGDYPKELKAQAARILASAMISTKDASKPQELVIRNYSSGITKMFGKDDDVEADVEADVEEDKGYKQ